MKDALSAVAFVAFVLDPQTPDGQVFPAGLNAMLVAATGAEVSTAIAFEQEVVPVFPAASDETTLKV